MVEGKIALDQYGVAQTCRFWYMSSEPPQTEHTCWQSPFAAKLNPDENRVTRIQRLRLAGEIWARNYDLSFFSELLLSDQELGISFAFRRPRRPGEPHLHLGPVSEMLVTHGQSLVGYPLVYREVNDSGLSRIWNTLLKRL